MEEKAADHEKAWGGRFGERAGKAAEAFTASIGFDRRLWPYEIASSIAHAKMLGNTGIISPQEASVIVEGLTRIARELKGGSFPFRPEHEDIHMNVESRLIELVGPVGGKLHTARSRNDQVALDMHMLVKDEASKVWELVLQMQEVLLSRAEECMEPEPLVMPGYTHLQRAQPVLLSHHLLAYFWMFQRDRSRLDDCRGRADMMPLGASALAGTSFPVDPEQVRGDLGFSRTYPNSIDAVSDRDFVLEFLSALSIIMIHLSRLAEEMVIWSSSEFGFVEFDDAYSTGSSIMPQKKNPDVAELVRAKAGRVFGHLMGSLTVFKALPLAYHSDMQEDKEGLFDAVDTVKACLSAMAGALATLKFNRERMFEAIANDFAVATEAADYLAKKGIPFREAHKIVGQMVRDCIRTGKTLQQMSVEELKAYSPGFDEDVLVALDARRSASLKTSPGGTAPERVREQISLARAAIS